MIIVVNANGDQKAELQAQPISPDAEIHYSDRIQLVESADVYVDLLFENSAERLVELNQLSASLIVVNSIITDEKELPATFVRLNAWPTFLKRPVAELSCADPEKRSFAEKLFSLLGRTTDWVPGHPGFISARVISMIINEAYFTLEENVSTKEEIDTAMKLGTNYPFGPFEWSQKIGLKKIYDLLIKLSATNKRYSPCQLLETDALKE
jgi:3-hydroxybutyryl-CoA dehydrogenase